MRITFTGVDESYPISNVLRVQYKYPEVEFAILYSENKSGKSLRYPSLNYINSLLGETSFKNFAFHLCGSSISSFLTYLELERKYRYSNIYTPMLRAKRIQFNCIGFFNNFKDGFELLKEDNIKIIQPVEDFSRAINKQVDVLWDVSGGKGKYTPNWPMPLEEQTCGYAGGICPENIATVLETVKSLKTMCPKSDIYIDIESGIREENGRLSHDKLLYICKEAYGY